jgi:hypothetical protein
VCGNLRRRNGEYRSRCHKVRAFDEHSLRVILKASTKSIEQEGIHGTPRRDGERQPKGTRVFFVSDFFHHGAYGDCDACTRDNTQALLIRFLQTAFSFTHERVRELLAML